MQNQRPDHANTEMRDTRVLPSVASDAAGTATVHQQLRVGAKGLITRNNRVLLIKERRADGSAFWTLPGGGVAAAESLPDTLRREIVEEIQCPSVVNRVVSVFVYGHTSRPTTTVYVVFEAALDAEPDPNPGEQIVDHAWWKPMNLPSTTLEPVEDVIAKVMTDRNRR